MKNGSVDTKSIYPAFPSGGVIINKNDIHTIYETGKGKVVLRGKVEIKNNKILITELPYQVYVQPYVEKITDMAIKDEITGIEAVYNKSGKNKLLIEIDCENNPEHVLKQLYTKTDLQKNYNANQWALVGKTPKLLTLKDYCQIYLNHNLECFKREIEFDLQKAKDRLHIIEGLLIALEDIDNVITLIKKSDSAIAAKTILMNKYNLSEIQAKSILAMRLSSLAKLEKIELENEKQELIKNIQNMQYILMNQEVQKEHIILRLEDLVKKYGDKRKTELVNISIKPEEKEIVEVTPEDCVIIMTTTGNIKRIPIKSFKVQKKNGKGIKSANDAILDTISTNTIDTLMLFTNKGKMYRTVVDNIPEGTNSSKGNHISNIINLEPQEEVIAISSLYRKTDAKYVVFFTKKGLIKKTYLDEYTKVKRNSGIQAIKLNEGDSIANVTFLNQEEVIVVTKNGMAIHFDTESINPIGRISAGVKAIKISDDDEVVIGLPIHKTTDYLSIVSKQGLGKKCKIEEFPFQNRGGKGLSCYKVSSPAEEIVGANMVDDNDNLLLSGKPNSICISIKDVPLLSRIGMGNQLIKNSNVISVVKL